MSLVNQNINEKKLHIALFPWLAFGHITPFLNLSKLLAQKGHKISFLTTQTNINRLPKIPSNLSKLITFVPLPLRHDDEKTLPRNAEATADLPLDKVPYLKKAYDELQTPLTRFLEASNPDWIIHDFVSHWLTCIARNLGISSAYFSIFNAFGLCFFLPPSSALVNGQDDPRTSVEHFTVPPPWVPFPSNVKYRVHEAKKLLNHFEDNVSGYTDVFRMLSVFDSVDLIMVRSCLKIEPEYVRLLEKLHNKPVVPIGMLPPTTNHENEVYDDDENDDTWHVINEWLNNQKKESVVYVAFGSELVISKDDIIELALGLELLGLPFFWALRKPNNIESEEFDDILPDGFEERVKGRAIVWTSWAPQQKILRHESVVAFVTHCGYSSIIEGLSFGKVLIFLPYSIDQGLNARFYSEKKVGIEIPRNEESGSFTRYSVAETTRSIVLENEGKVCKNNTFEMKKIFTEPKLNDQYINDLIEYLQTHKADCDVD